jgi:predicted GTPase
MVLEAVRRTNEIATLKHADEHRLIKMDEIIETERASREIVEVWQTVRNQPSNKIRKNNAHVPSTAKNFFQPTTPMYSKSAEFTLSSLSAEVLLSQFSSESLAYTDERR